MPRQYALYHRPRPETVGERMHGNRRIWAVVATALGVAGLAAQAWACVPQPLVYIEPLSSGPAGSQVTVNASAISGEAEVRWNGLDGPELAKASGAHFAVPVTIPADAREGLYAIVVLTRTAGGGVTSTGRAAFLVTPPGGPAAGGSATGGTAAPGSNPEAKRSSNGVSGAGLVLGVAGVLVVGLALGAVIGRVAKRSSGNPPVGESLPSSP